MDNTGGLVKIYVCPVSNISDSGQIIDQERLIQVNFILDSAKRKCTRKDDKNGEYYDLKIECTVARSDKDNFYTELLLNNFVVITSDSNNITRIDGTRNEPLRYQIESDTGEEFEDLNCVKLEFSRKLRFPSPLISL